MRVSKAAFPMRHGNARGVAIVMLFFFSPRNGHGHWCCQRGSAGKHGAPTRATLACPLACPAACRAHARHPRTPPTRAAYARRLRAPSMRAAYARRLGYPARRQGHPCQRSDVSGRQLSMGVARGSSAKGHWRRSLVVPTKTGRSRELLHAIPMEPTCGSMW